MTRTTQPTQNALAIGFLLLMAQTAVFLAINCYLYLVNAFNFDRDLEPWLIGSAIGLFVVSLSAANIVLFRARNLPMKHARLLFVLGTALMSIAFMINVRLFNWSDRPNHFVLGVDSTSSNFCMHLFPSDVWNAHIRFIAGPLEDEPTPEVSGIPL